MKFRIAALALACAFLAATFLAAEAERAGDPDLAGSLSRKALVTGLVTGAVALVAVLVLETDAETLASGLHGRALVFVIGSAVAGLRARRIEPRELALAEGDEVSLFPPVSGG